MPRFSLHRLNGAASSPNADVALRTPQDAPQHTALPDAALPEEPAPVAEQAQEAELIVAIFRTLVLGLALFVPRVFSPGESNTQPQIALAALAGIFNLGATLAALFPQRLRLRRSLLVTMDMMLITSWIHLSQQWGLFPFFYIVVVVAGMWGRVFGAILTAILCDFFYLYLWGYAASDPRLFPPAFTTQMVLGVVLLPLVGALAGSVSEAQEKERERRLERELLIANYQREIDLAHGLRPSLAPGFDAALHPSLDLGAAMLSARALGGGDYCDALVLPDGRVALLLADVSGKSARAQARLPLLRYALRVLAPLCRCPEELVARLDQTLSPDLDADSFIALCCIVLDADARCLSWCNAGHIAPLLIADGKVAELDPDGPALGLFPGALDVPAAEVCTRSLPWRPGDVLLLFTDGLPDALSHGGEADGEDQVRRLALSLDSDKDATQAAQRLVSLARASLDASFAPSTKGETGHRDDITVAVARFRVE